MGKRARKVSKMSRHLYSRPKKQIEKGILYQLGYGPPPRKNRRKLRKRWRRIHRFKNPRDIPLDLQS